MPIERRKIRRDGGRRGGGGARARTGIAVREGSGTSEAGWPLRFQAPTLVGSPGLCPRLVGHHFSLLLAW